jgi:uncharacterized protein (DUF433 family)
MARYPLNLPPDLKREAEELAKAQGVSLNQFILWSVSEKVGALKQKLDDPNYPQITYRRGAAGIPTPVLRGTGIRVQTVVITNREWGMEPAEIAGQYGVDQRLIETALRFYQSHQEEIDVAIQTEERIRDAAR